MTRTVKQIAQTIQKAPGIEPVQLRLATVAAVSPSTGTVSIFLSAELTQVDGVAVMSGTWPVVNDVVWVMKNGTDLVVLGLHTWAPDPMRIVSAQQVSAAGNATLPSASTTRQLLPGFALTGVPVVSGRWYWVRARGTGAMNDAFNSGSQAGYVVLKTGVTISDGTDLSLAEMVPSRSTNGRFSWRFEHLYQAASTGTVDFLVAAYRQTATTFAFVVGNSGVNDPGHIAVCEAARDDGVITSV